MTWLFLSYFSQSIMRFLQPSILFKNPFCSLTLWKALFHLWLFFLPPLLSWLYIYIYIYIYIYVSWLYQAWSNWSASWTTCGPSTVLHCPFQRRSIGARRSWRAPGRPQVYNQMSIKPKPNREIASEVELLDQNGVQANKGNKIHTFCLNNWLPRGKNSFKAPWQVISSHQRCPECIMCVNVCLHILFITCLGCNYFILCIIYNIKSLLTNFPWLLTGRDGSKITTVVATPGQGTDRVQEVSYTDTKVIGNGSFGVVFQAKLCDTGELVAIKKVLQDRRFKVRSPWEYIYTFS